MLLVSIAFSFDRVQTWAARKAVALVNEQFHTDIQLGKLKYRWPNRVGLYNVYLPSDAGDTVAFIAEGEVGILGYSDANYTLALSHIHADGMKLIQRVDPGDSVNAFMRFIDKVTADTTSSGRSFHFWVDDIEVKGFQYRFLEPSDTAFFLAFDQGYLHASNLRVDGPQVAANFEEVSFLDPYKVNLESFHGQAMYAPDGISVQNAFLQTAGSELKGNLALEYDNIADFSSFLDSVSLNLDLDQLQVSSEEFQSYVPAFPALGTLALKGRIKGPVNAMFLDDGTIRAGSNTVYRGTAWVYTPTSAEDIKLQLNAKPLTTSGADIQKLVPPVLGDSLPAAFATLGPVAFSGSFSGPLNAFHVHGLLKALKGTTKVNLDYTILKSEAAARYAGTFEMKGINPASWQPQSEVQRVDGVATIRGQGLDWGHLDTKVDARLDQLVFRNFNYGSSTIKGEAHKGVFALDLENKGKDFPLRMKGDGFIRQDSSAYDFELTTGALELYKAGWVKDSLARGAAAATLDVKGRDAYNWTGKVEVSDLLYENQNRAYYFKDINLTSDRSGDERTISLISDLGTAHLSGIFTPSEIPGMVNQAINRVVRVVDEPKEFESRSLKAEVSLNNTDIVFDLLKVNLSLEPGTVAELVTYTDVAFSHFEFITPGIQTGQSRLGPTQVLVSASNDKPFVNLESDFFTVIGGMETDSILLAVKPQQDSIDIAFSTVVKDSTPIHLKTDLRVFAGADSTVDILLKSLKFNLGKYDFASEGRGGFVWNRKSRLEARGVAIRQRGYGTLQLNGAISTNPADTLTAQVDGLQIALVDHLFKDNRFRLSGLMDAKMGVSNVYERAVLSGFMRVENFALNTDTLGALDATLDLDRSLNRVVVEADIVRGTRTFLDAKGYIGTKEPYNLEFNLALDRLRLKPFEPILAGALNRLRGTVNGNLSFFGTTSAPQMKGNLTVHRAGFGIPYLGVDYALEGTPNVIIEPGRIVLPRSGFRETSDGSSGEVEGGVYHKNLSNWELDIRAQGKDLLALKKPEGPEEFLYGKAYANGNIRIYGPVDMLNIRADATSAAGSEVFINADNPTEVGESGFVEFVTPGAVLLDSTKERNIPSGLDFELNLTLVPNSKGNLILDQEAGDAISGSGTGKLKIRLKRDGSLTMAGTITVEEGEYLFTLRNLTRKVLKVERGGTISWTGDPYQANLNISALYSVKTSLSPPLDPAQFAGKRGIAQVDVRLTDELTNPTIGFSIRLPNEPPNVQSALNNKLYDQDKINQQAFSLLIFNSFTADQGAEQNYLDRGLSNTYNMVASQLANYINAGNDAFDLTLNYNTSANANPSGNPGSEVEVGVSKQFFDDRITVNGSVGVPVGGNTTNQLVGDVEVEVRISKDGRWKGKAFNRNNQYGNTSALAQQNAYTQGVGVQYSTDFDTWGEFWDKLFKKKPKEEDENPE